MWHSRQRFFPVDRSCCQLWRLAWRGGVFADGQRAQGVGGALRLPPREVAAHLDGNRNLHRRAEQAAEELRNQQRRASERCIRDVRRREAKATIESKIAGYRAALAEVQPLTNRRTKFVVLAFEASGWTDPTVRKLVKQRASRRLGPDRLEPTGVAGVHQMQPDAARRERSKSKDVIMGLGVHVPVYHDRRTYFGT
jgi:hypothetical protein